MHNHFCKEYHVYKIDQQSLNFLAPGTSFVEDLFFTDWGTEESMDICADLSNLDWVPKHQPWLPALAAIPEPIATLILHHNSSTQTNHACATRG